MDDLAFDGRQFYDRSEDRVWRPLSAGMVTSVLKVRGFTSKTGKGEAASPLDRAMNTILLKRRVDGAAPFLYHKGDIWESGGRKFLNTSSVRLLPAAPTSDAWGVKFPLIAQVYDNVFAQDRYRDIFLAWFKRFYESAEKGKIALGQALALVGPVHCYKSWTVHKIIKPSMGGFADLGNMANGSAGGFTADVFQSPIAVIDDDKGTSSEEKRRRYSATIKQLVAHGTHMYHKKFETPTEVEWRGRVILAINDDPISIRLLPDLNQSNEDKTIALTMKTWHDHPAPEVFDGLEDTELPHFLAWLKDWAPPEAILEPRSRYGVRSIIADEVREASFASSAAGSIEEMLAEWWARRPASERKLPFVGTSLAILEELGACFKNSPEQMRGLDRYRLGIRLRELADRGNKGVSILPKRAKHKGGNKYEVFMPWVESRSDVTYHAAER
jgi:hypothetical protein